MMGKDSKWDKFSAAHPPPKMAHLRQQAKASELAEPRVRNTMEEIRPEGFFEPKSWFRGVVLGGQGCVFFSLESWRPCQHFE